MENVFLFVLGLLLHIIEIFKTRWLEVVTSLLAIFNGLIAIRLYLRDKAHLVIRSVHSEVYQWWFRLPDIENDERIIRRFGFLIYISIANTGMRPISVDSVELVVKSKNYRKVVLLPRNMPEPRLEGDEGTHSKRFPVLLQNTENFNHSGLIQPGDNTSGMALFIYECFGDEAFDPKFVGKSIKAYVIMRDVMGKRKKLKLIIKEKDLDQIRNLIPGFEELV